MEEGSKPIADKEKMIRETLIALVDHNTPDDRLLGLVKEAFEELKEEWFLYEILSGRGSLSDRIDSRTGKKQQGLSHKKDQSITDQKAELKRNRKELDTLLKAISGLARVRGVDPELFQRIMNEYAAAYLFVLVSRQLMAIIKNLSEISEVKDRNSDAMHIRELSVSGSFDGQSVIRRIRKVFQSLGVSYIAPELIWKMLVRTERDKNYAPEVKRYAYWPHYDLFKDVFSSKLIFEITDDDVDLCDERSSEFLCSGLSMLEGIMNLKYLNPIIIGNSWPKASRYCFEKFVNNWLELIDGIRWQSEGTIQQRRYDMEEAIIAKGDSEMLLMCLEKNVIPACDVERLLDLLKKDHKEMLPLLILKKYGYLEQRHENV